MTSGATRAAAYLPRWGLHVRLTHWGLALAYFGLLGSGLALGSDDLGGIPFMGSRLVREIHLTWAVLLFVLPAVAASWDSFGALGGLVREAAHLTPADWRWLQTALGRTLGRSAEMPAQGRLNAGQKLNLLLVLGLLSGLALTGALVAPPAGRPVPQAVREALYEIHVLLAYATIPLIAAHVVLAVAHPATRPSLRGMIVGTVRADWARRHHAAWANEALAAGSAEASGER